MLAVKMKDCGRISSIFFVCHDFGSSFREMRLRFFEVLPAHCYSYVALVSTSIQEFHEVWEATSHCSALPPRIAHGLLVIYR